MNLSYHIEQIVKKTESSKVANPNINGLMRNIQPLKEFLNITDHQTLLFALVFHNTLESGNADLSDIARHFEIPVLRMLKHKRDLDVLIRKRLIRQQDNGLPFGRGARSNSLNYYVHSNIIDGIINKSLSNDFGEITNSIDFLIHIMGEMENAADDVGGYNILKDDFRNICRESKNIGIARNLLNSDIPEHEKLILVFMTYKLLNGEDDITISDACEFLDNDKAFQLRVRRSFMNGKSMLIKRGLIEAMPGAFRNESDMNVTDKGLEFLLGEEAQQFSIQSKRVKNEILPEKIPLVNLFLNPNEKEQLHTIQGIFEKDKFNEITARMQERNMKAGFPVLFYGSPGTGKTESVYQLARATGRSILPVEISQTKSLWFGESEKLIKGIFNNYRQLCSGSKEYPILLFNEADGIFGKRTSKTDSAVSQTMNAMQNIILQEMEDFEGIMIATTNLSENLDNAFDRRFLYKVKFENPNLDIRLQIMQEKIPFLTPEAVRQLCEQYKLTGGQMANIRKKCNIHEILNGKLPDSGKVNDFCLEELDMQTKAKLGF